MITARRALFQFDGNSIGSSIRLILFCVNSGPGHVNVVGLAAGLIIQKEHYSIENVLMPHSLIVRLKVNPKDSNLIVFEQDLVVLGINDGGVERCRWGRTGWFVF